MKKSTILLAVPIPFLFSLQPCLGGMFSGLPNMGWLDLKGLDNLADFFTGDPAVDIARIMDPKNIRNIKTADERDRLFLQVTYCLAIAEEKQPYKRDAEEAITQAGIKNGTQGSSYFEIMKDQLLQRLQEAEDYGILDGQDLQRLKQGELPQIKNGSQLDGNYLVVEIIPSSICPEIKNEIINLRLVRDKSEWSKKTALRFARHLNENNLLTNEGLNALKKELESLETQSSK